MLTNIIPAASFTVATVAPSMLGSASSALRWISQNPSIVAVPLTVAVVLLIAWAFAPQAFRRRPVAPAQPGPAPTATVLAAVPARGER